jgi:hypothetical protein
MVLAIKRILRARRAAVVATAIAVLGLSGTAYAAVVGLPSDGSQVNDDPAAGIDPGQDAGLSDVVGGSLKAGGARVPWGTFEQKAGSAQRIFVRAFKNGAWVTQGRSLNIDQGVEAEGPSIDFAGAGRVVPWDSWYEPSAPLGGQKQIFASRFCAATNAICQAANTWVPEGQDRGSGIPSLNIHTGKEAENPSVAGGAAVAGNDPVPWVAWQEQDGNVAGAGNRDQIFVSKGVKQGRARQPCSGFKPSANATVSFFCWQQVGLDRLAPNGGSSSTGDPTLNVDPSRNGIEPDIAFTGASDAVAWVVWYEIGSSSLGLRSNDQVFAAKIVKDTSADGGFRWQAVGAGTAGSANPLDTSTPPHGFGPCGASTSSEDACSLNKVATREAEDPRVAAGTLKAGKTTVPWVTWAEDVGGGHHAIFVSRLVDGDHFELFNGGRPLSSTAHDATHPDITFFGNVPYVSWIETRGSATRGFVGHFEDGVFLRDTPGGIRLTRGHGRANLIDFRVPISSSCTADPFTKDGAACPIAPLNAPFFLFTTAGSPQRLFGQAALGGLNCVLFRHCKVTIRIRHGRAVIVSSLGTRSRVGILVQRILRSRRVHGRLVRRLHTVGRVPLGRHRRGRVRLRWSLRVKGHRLRRGRYLVTLRALDSKKRVLGIAKGVTVRIR